MAKDRRKDKERRRLWLWLREQTPEYKAKKSEWARQRRARRGPLIGCRMKPGRPKGEIRLTPEQRAASLQRQREQVRAWYDKNKEQVNARATAWAKSHPEQLRDSCPVHFCTEKKMKTARLCRSCCLFGKFLYGWSQQVDEFHLFHTTKGDKQKWQQIRSQRQAQTLRKRLLKTLQSQISESQAALLESSLRA